MRRIVSPSSLRGDLNILNIFVRDCLHELQSLHRSPAFYHRAESCAGGSEERDRGPRNPAQSAPRIPPCHPPGCGVVSLHCALRWAQWSAVYSVQLTTLVRWNAVRDHLKSFGSKKPWLQHHLTRVMSARRAWLSKQNAFSSGAFLLQRKARFHV